MILPSNEAGNPDGWKAVGGDECCPYAEKLGGVSLFDFDGFEPVTCSHEYPLSSWQFFVPYRDDWGSAVWIEIDRAQVTSRLISPSALVEKWKLEEDRRHNFMPCIEAVHLGPLHRAAFKRAFLIGKGDTEIRLLDM